MDKLDLKELRAAFGTFMTGVTIITAKSENGTMVGFTANSFASVSLDPPLLLVCPGNHLSSIDVFRQCRHFAVNILREGQEEISNIFASSKEDRFSKVPWKADENGVPLISDALASFSCSAHSKLEAGDHLVLIGEVTAFSRADGLGLGYWRGGYFSLSSEREALASPGPRSHIVVGAIVENDNRIFVVRKSGELSLPSVRLPGGAPARSGIKAQLEEIGIIAEIGRVYSVYHDTKSNDRFIYFRATGTLQSKKDGGEYVSIEAAASAAWSDAAEGVMVRRYLEERGNNQFGLYIGDTFSGEIHSDEHSQ